MIIKTQGKIKTIKERIPHIHFFQSSNEEADKIAKTRQSVIHKIIPRNISPVCFIEIVSFSQKTLSSFVMQAIWRGGRTV